MHILHGGNISNAAISLSIPDKGDFIGKIL